MTVYGKRVFTSVMKLRILRWGNYPEFSGSSKWNHKCPCKREEEGDLTIRRPRSKLLWFEDEGRGQELRSARNMALEAGKGKQRDSPLRSPERVQPC